MIRHDANSSAVRAWVERDPLLSRMAFANDGPVVSLVGGAVRDALIGVAHGVDIDLVVEGDAIVVATEMGRCLGGRVVVHERFGTARVEVAHGRHVDIVTARRETYSSPGALPDVSPGTLDDDLARRDFTVNAIALRLSGASAGELVDPYGGVVDLAAERLRAIRSGVFTEDPSRVIRALRYAARLGFRMDDATEREVRACMPDVDVSSSRVGDELQRLLTESSAAAALDMAIALGAQWPDRDGRRTDRLDAVQFALARPGAPQPAAWALRLGLGVASDSVDRTAVAGWARAVAAEVRAGLALGERLAGEQAPSLVDTALRGRPDAEQVGAFVGGAHQVARWWEEWRDLGPSINGTDLVAAGVAPGPDIGRALAVVRAAVLDGAVGGHEAQLALALAEVGTN